ncbi:MAG: hypothetical protein E7334_08380 [Clostridiales bacterium]|nr:hypothetical protein [Clostridiales bacterium]
MIIRILKSALALFVSFTFISAIYHVNRAYTVSAAVSPLLGKVIVVDAGHGGYDSGTVGRTTGVLEKDLNLSVALKLRDILSQNGASVIMTRDTDKALCPENTKVGEKKQTDMAARAMIIEEANADIVLSIHMNDYAISKYHGAQVFYLEGSGNKSDGALLAGYIQSRLINDLDPTNTRKIKAGDYYILRMKTASVLIECGFLSNKNDELLLQDDSYQSKLAWCIYSGVIDYLNHSEIAVSSESLSISWNEFWRSSAFSASPVRIWSDTVSTASAFLPKRAAFI